MIAQLLQADPITSVEQFQSLFHPAPGSTSTTSTATFRFGISPISITSTAWVGNSDGPYAGVYAVMYGTGGVREGEPYPRFSFRVNPPSNAAIQLVSDGTRNYFGNGMLYSLDIGMVGAQATLTPLYGFYVPIVYSTATPVLAYLTETTDAPNWQAGITSPYVWSF